VALVTALIDSGPLVAYYNQGDEWHATAQKFFEGFRGKLLTSEAVATEVMWLLADDFRVQNEFLSDLRKELYTTAALIPSDFKYIAELNEKYRDRTADFADLTVVVICERLGIANVVSLDEDFDIYRLYGNKTFNQLFSKVV
jgi:predicted nucleic acid-binding protein